MDLVIYGAGGLGKEILRLILESPAVKKDDSFQILGFVDDCVEPGRQVSEGFVVLGSKEWFVKREEPAAVVLGIASVEHKEEIINFLKKYTNIHFPSFLHPSSYVSPTAIIGRGVIVSPFCFVSEDAKVGDFVFLNVASQVGHDSLIGDFCSIMPCVNVSGNVEIGKGSFIGVKATLLQGVKIGKRVKVDAGSLVYREIEDDCTVCGMPARVIARGGPKE